MTGGHPEEVVTILRRLLDDVDAGRLPIGGSRAVVDRVRVAVVALESSALFGCDETQGVA